MNEKEQNQELEELEKVDEIFELEENQDEVEQHYEEDTTSGGYEYYEPEYVTNTKPLGKLVLLVAFTAIMLISSTYAWFSTQRNVTLTGLKGEVNVAEGLQISLDAERWFNTINFDDFEQPANGGAWTMKTGASAQYIASGKTFQNPAEGVTNVTPSEYLPVSSTGATIDSTNSITDGIGASAMKFYKGNVQNFDHLEDIADVAEATGGYYAFDLFVMNTSASDIKWDNIKLDPVSDVIGTVETTGVQNTARVAFALYENVNDTASHVAWDAEGYTPGEDMTINSGNQLTPAQIIAGTSTSKNIKDIAIWEPNANDHVAAVVNQFKGQMIWPATWTTGAGSLPAGDFADGDYLPTYALTVSSKTATYQRQTAGANTPGDTSDDTYVAVTGIKDIYNWSDAGIAESKLKLQYTTQTSADAARPTSIELNSLQEYENPTGKELDGTTTNDGSFDIPANQYSKIRVYVWMEGQDPDCINYASLGAGMTLNLGFSKGEYEPNDDEEPEVVGGPYLPSGFSWANAEHTEIKDPSNNQYVWVSVPRDATVYNDLTDDAEDTGMSDTTNEDILAFDVNSLTADNLTAIETELKEYTATYRNGTTYKDEFYSTDQHGFADATAYNNHKNTMLASVFKNEGFYVGKYETGIMEGPKTSSNISVEIPSETPVIQANAYPYNFVTNKQAQKIASTKFNGGGYTTSLMFGLQWDLVLKHLEMKTDLEVADLNSNSTSWGNYTNNEWTIANEDAKYSDDYGESWKDGVDMTNPGYILLSIGASNDFERGGIYDLAGNVWEWTLEYTSSTNVPCAFRGGYYDGYGDLYPASYRFYNGTSFAIDVNGFRVSLW